MRLLRFDGVMQVGVDKLSSEDYELLLVCLWLVWYIRNIMVMDKTEDGIIRPLHFVFLGPNIILRGTSEKMM